MAEKHTQMAADAQAEAEELKAQARKNYLGEADLWDKTREPEYGGQSDILDLEVGEVSQPLTYVAQMPMKTALGDTTVHTAETPNNTMVRLPIQASFLRSLDQAQVRRGDKFIVKRFEDVTKKTGKGAGNDMKIYAIKVIARAAVPGATV